jgi:predicted nucleic acid-binding protein
VSGPLALDTSVAVALLVQTHSAHTAVVRWRAGRKVALSGHALAETYSVLTRLPGDVRLTPAASAPFRARRCGPASARALFPPLLLGPKTSRQLPEILAQMEVAGGAVYDALVALAAAEHGADLAGHPRRPGKGHLREGRSTRHCRRRTRLGGGRYVPGQDDPLVVLGAKHADRPGVQPEQPSG